MAQCRLHCALHHWPRPPANFFPMGANCDPAFSRICSAANDPLAFAQFHGFDHLWIGLSRLVERQFPSFHPVVQRGPGREFSHLCHSNLARRNLRRDHQYHLHVSETCAG